jgi:hypothetical protein
MVNIRTPRILDQVHKNGFWPPKGAREYTVKDADDWWSIAAREKIDAWELIKFNFHTHVPEEVNWYLRELVGCHHSKDGRNFAFMGADPSKRKIYLPALPPPPPPPVPIPIPPEDRLKKLRYEVEHSFDPQKPRFLCILDALINNGDDRTIFWSDVAPDDGVMPPGVLKAMKSIHDSHWLQDRVKSVQDIDRMPPGTGMPDGSIVTSFRRYLLEGFNPTIFHLRAGSDEIGRTHENLSRWANFPMGGSGGMPLRYKAMNDFVHRQEGIPGSVLSCVVTTGTKWPP